MCRAAKSRPSAPGPLGRRRTTPIWTCLSSASRRLPAPRSLDSTRHLRNPTCRCASMSWTGTAPHTRSASSSSPAASGCRWPRVPIGRRQHLATARCWLATKSTQRAVKTCRTSGWSTSAKARCRCLATARRRMWRAPRPLFRAGDILFGKLRPYFRKVVRPDFDGICSTDIWAVRPKAGLDAGFLFYLMASEAFVDFANQGSEGTRMPRAKWEHVADYPVRLPPVMEQRAIARTLDALGHRIELNRRMAETLGKAVGALFKSWFVDKREQAGWRSWRLDELATNVQISVNPYSHPDVTYEHYSIPAHDAGRRPVVEVGSRIRSNKTLVPKGAVLVSKLNPSTPRVWIPDCRGAMTKVASTEFLVFVPKTGFGRGLLWGIFGSRGFQQALQGLATGTSKSHQRARRSDVVRLECVTGEQTVFAAFDSLVAPLVEQEVLVTTSTGALRSLRDTLLPKLILGEIRVPEAEKLAEAVT